MAAQIDLSGFKPEEFEAQCLPKRILRSPIPTVILALAVVYLNHCCDLSVFKSGLVYTVVMLVLGCLGNRLGYNFGLKLKYPSDPSLSYAIYLFNSLLFVSPKTISYYKIMIFWAVLITVSGLMKIFY